MDPDMAISSMLGPDVTMALVGSMGLSDQYGPSNSVVIGLLLCPTWGPRPPAVVKPLMIIEAMDLNTDPGCYMAMGPDMAPGHSSGQMIMAPGVSMGHPDLYGPGVNMTLGHRHGIRYLPIALVSRLPLVVIRAMDVYADPGCSRTTDQDMVLSKSWVWILPWLWVVAQDTQIGISLASRRPSDTNMAPSGGSDLVQPHSFQW